MVAAASAPAATSAGTASGFSFAPARGLPEGIAPIHSAEDIEDAADAAAQAVLSMYPDSSPAGSVPEVDLFAPSPAGLASTPLPASVAAAVAAASAPKVADLPAMLSGAAGPAVSLPPLGTVGPLPSPMEPLGRLGMPSAAAPRTHGAGFPNGATNGSATNGSMLGAAAAASTETGGEPESSMTQEEAKAAAEKALLGAAAEMKRIAGTEWEEEYGGLEDLAAAREEQSKAMGEHEAILALLREAYSAARIALAKKFQKLETSAAESQHTRMFVLQRAASAIQKREYEATLYDITPAAKAVSSREDVTPPAATTQSALPAAANGFSFAPA